MSVVEELLCLPLDFEGSLEERKDNRMMQVIESALNWSRQLWKQFVLRSGVVTIGILVLMVLGLAIGWRAHRRGRFAQFKAGLRNSESPREPLPPRPGGQDAIVLDRSPLEEGKIPEFTSATILPGRGMNVLQITAALPGKGRVNLLASPTLEEAVNEMSGTADDAYGGASLAMGGAVEAPWSGKLFGAANANILTAHWNGNVLRIPVERKNGAAIATGGLLLNRKGTAVKSNVMPDGGEAEAVYNIEDFDGAWPSKMRVRTTVQMSGRAMTMKIVATNTGNAPEPVGLGWRPRFAVLSKDRSQMRLRLPSVTKEELRGENHGRDSSPTGQLVSVEGTAEDFSAIEGRALGKENLEGTFVDLRQAALDSGPVAELWDPENQYGLRITMLSASIKAIHVSAPADGSFVMLDPSFNYDDPFGAEWPKDEKAGMVTLQPGGSVQWSIRLEIYGPPKPPDPNGD